LVHRLNHSQKNDFLIFYFENGLIIIYNYINT